jgi:hypothetical protein
MQAQSAIFQLLYKIAAIYVASSAYVFESLKVRYFSCLKFQALQDRLEKKNSKKNNILDMVVFSYIIAALCLTAVSCSDN